MHQINLVTHNKNKFKEFKNILEPEIEINHIDKEYKELRSDSNEEIAADSAFRMSRELNKAVVVEDSGLFISALNEFPGTCSAYVHKRIGLDGILKLMKDIKDRECFYRSAVAFCEPQKKPLVFFGEEKGIISNGVRGAFGFGHDPIFIPEGSGKTYGEMKDCIEKKKFRKMAILKLRDYLLRVLKKLT